MKKTPRTYGEIKYFKGLQQHTANYFLITHAEPHVAIVIKQVFSSIPKSELDKFRFSATDDMCHNLLWFLSRYPMQMDENTRKKLHSGRRRFLLNQSEMESILADDYTPRQVQLKHGHAARPYQLKGAEIYLRSKKMLLCDDLGLGKSLTATLSFFEPKTMPALIVCQTHLPTQWKENTIEKFTNLTAHIIKTGPVYKLPPADVYIISYSKLAKWGPLLHTVIKSIIWDEVQELRCGPASNGGVSLKYAAARNLCEKVNYTIGLSGSPIYNYGIEMFNIINCLNRGCIGTHGDFYREWGGKVVRNPQALGTYLREKFLLLRRTDKEVDRELPPLNTIIKTVDYDEYQVEQEMKIAEQLALSYLSAVNFSEKGHAAQEFDIRLRQITGIAKAHQVAALVRILLENDKPVVLSGWHRQVYEIWLNDLKEFKPVMYTGSETPVQKNEAVRKFTAGETNLFIISNRSGIGLDGLQHRCRDLVIGELDYSPQVHKQIIGRINRDGQTQHCTVYFPVCDFGSDPAIIEILGLKSEQSHGIIDPLLEMKQQHTDESRIKLMAENYLKKQGEKKH